MCVIDLCLKPSLDSSSRRAHSEQVPPIIVHTKGLVYFFVKRPEERVMSGAETPLTKVREPRRGPEEDPSREAPTVAKRACRVAVSDRQDVADEGLDLLAVGGAK